MKKSPGIYLSDEEFLSSILHRLTFRQLATTCFLVLEQCIAHQPAMHHGRELGGSLAGGGCIASRDPERSDSDSAGRKIGIAPDFASPPPGPIKPHRDVGIGPCSTPATRQRRKFRHHLRFGEVVCVWIWCVRKWWSHAMRFDDDRSEPPWASRTGSSCAKGVMGGPLDWGCVAE